MGGGVMTTESSKRLAEAHESLAKTYSESAKLDRFQGAGNAAWAADRLAASLREQARKLRGGGTR
jgi:hypothetical protein